VTAPTTEVEARIAARFSSVVIGARVGDAMGTPTENLSAKEIHDRFGWVSDFEGDGTDDSLMANILAEALIETEGAAGLDDWASRLVTHRDEIVEKRDFFFSSVIHLLDKLRRGYAPSGVAFGNMPSSSSAMCIWPVALVNPANPRVAAAHAYDLAHLVQVAPVDHCLDAAAALAAAISSAFLPGATARTTIDHAMEVIRPTSGAVFKKVLVEALRLAETSSSYEAFRISYQAQFARPIACDALETVPAALSLVLLAGGDVRMAVEYGANFGRDSDTIACMAGALAGALTDSVPESWLTTLGPDQTASARSLAAALASTARLHHQGQLTNLQQTTEFLEG
jgi:ADP-ribosylglycohydrolase